MTDEIRRIARLARRFGYRAQTLGNFTDAQWRDFRDLAECSRATPLDLANAVDLMLRLEDGRDAQWDTR